jgi:hypothetical protein
MPITDMQLCFLCQQVDDWLYRILFVSHERVTTRYIIKCTLQRNPNRDGVILISIHIVEHTDVASGVSVNISIGLKAAGIVFRLIQL